MFPPDRELIPSLKGYKREKKRYERMQRLENRKQYLPQGRCPHRIYVYSYYIPALHLFAYTCHAKQKDAMKHSARIAISHYKISYYFRFNKTL